MHKFQVPLSTGWRCPAPPRGTRIVMEKRACAAQPRDTFQSCRNKACGNPLPKTSVTKP